MLVIGKRGAAGLAPENTIESIKAALEAGVDMVHVDVRLTRDNVPVLLHDISLKRTHQANVDLASVSLVDLDHHCSLQPIPTLESVLDKFETSTILLLEVRNTKSAKVVAELLAERYKNSPKKLENIVLAAYKATDLYHVKQRAQKLQLALMHDNNPFSFMAHMRTLNLVAVGFHRLHTNRFSLEVAKKAGLFTFAYTVNRPEAATILAKKGFDAVVSSYPDRIISKS